MKWATNFFLLTVVTAAGLAARDEQVRDYQKTVPLAPGGAVHVEHSMGGVVVRTHAGQDVSVHATIRCSASSTEDAKKCVDRIEVILQATPNDVSLRTRYPESSSGWFGRSVSYSVRYDILIPESARLDLRNRFGPVEVSGLRAPGSIRNSNGSLRFSGGRGAQRLQNSFGPIEVDGNAGELTIENTNGAVTVSGAEGPVDLRNRFGKVTVTRCAGGTIRNNNGAVEVSGAGGNVNVSNSFGAVTVTDARGDVTVDNANGAVEVRNVDGAADLKSSFAAIRFSRIGRRLVARTNNGAVIGESVGGAAQVESSFGNVELRGVKAGARVQSANASVRVSDVTGEVFAATSFGGVTVENAGGPVTVENQNGSVTVRSTPDKGCRPVIAKTSFAPIRIAIPPGTGYTVEARTSFGKISSELEMTTTGAIGGDALNAKIAGGGCELRLNNANGNIEIAKAGR